MNYFEKRVKNVKDNVTLRTVLKDYGLYPFTYEIADFQMRCPFHGKDERPSAHLYAPNEKTPYETFHCHGCGRHHDVIAFVQEYEAFDKPGEAIKKIETKYNLTKVAFQYEEDATKEIRDLLNQKKEEMSIYDFHRILERQIIEAKKNIPLEKYVKIFLALDRATFEDKMDLMYKIKEKLEQYKKPIPVAEDNQENE